MITYARIIVITVIKTHIDDASIFTRKLKLHYNRPRPYQIAEFYGIDLNGTELESMKTPAYPSGHAIQGYLIADIMSKHDSSNAEVYQKIGENIAQSRVTGKAHYPSDKEYGKQRY